MDEKETSELKKEKEPTNWWVTLIIYLVELGIATGLFFTVLGVRDFFNASLDLATKYKYLADAFTIPGMVFIGIGLLVILSYWGAFEGIGYAVRHLARMLLPFLIREDITYAEYLEKRKARQKRLSFLSFLIVGVLFMMLAIIFVALFNKVS